MNSFDFSSYFEFKFKEKGFKKKKKKRKLERLQERNSYLIPEQDLRVCCQSGSTKGVVSACSVLDYYLSEHN